MIKDSVCYLIYHGASSPWGDAVAYTGTAESLHERGLLVQSSWFPKWIMDERGRNVTIYTKEG